MRTRPRGARVRRRGTHPEAVTEAAGGWRRGEARAKGRRDVNGARLKAGHGSRTGPPAGPSRARSAGRARPPALPSRAAERDSQWARTALRASLALDAMTQPEVSRTGFANR